jgi:hypothetical protein
MNDSDRARIHASAIKKSPPNETVAITRRTSRIQIADRTRAVGTNPRRAQDPVRDDQRSVRTSNLLGLTFDSRDLAVGPVRSEDLGAELRAKNHPEVGLGIVHADGDM